MEWVLVIVDQYYYFMGFYGFGKRRRRLLINVLMGKLLYIFILNKGMNYFNCI